MSAIRLGVGAEGPWENRHELIRNAHPNPGCETYSVQLFRHPTHPGIDHLYALSGSGEIKLLRGRPHRWTAMEGS